MSKKAIFAGLGVFVALILGAALYITTHLGGIVGDMIEAYGKSTTGTDVTVRSVDISLTEGRGDLKGLTIDNPPGFDTDYFLRVDDIKLALDSRSLAGAVPVVKEVLIDSALLNAEQRGDALNLVVIERKVSQPSAQPPSEPADEGKIIIDRFRLTHGKVTLTSDLLKKPEDIDLADVVVEGIGRTKGGATYDEATAAVLNPILRAARSAVEARLRDAAAESARDEVEKKASDKLKDLLNKN